jgi:hypothetical protein
MFYKLSMIPDHIHTRKSERMLRTELFHKTIKPKVLDRYQVVGAKSLYTCSLGKK